MYKCLLDRAKLVSTCTRYLSNVSYYTCWQARLAHLVARLGLRSGVRRLDSRVRHILSLLVSY